MRIYIPFLKNCEVFYYNCVECGKPMFDELQRQVGWCGCGMGGKKKPVGKKVVASKMMKYDESDPYGQPAEVVNG